MILFLLGIISFLIGFFIIVFISQMVRKNIIREANNEAQDIISQAQQKAEELINEKKLDFEEFQHDLEIKSEKEITQFSDSIEQLKINIAEKSDELNTQLNKKRSYVSKKQKRYDRALSFLKSEKDSLASIRKKYRTQIKSYKDSLKSLVGNEVQELKDNISTQVIEKTKTDMVNWATDFEEETERTADRKAKKILDIALNRFMRPYCAERGIQYVSLKNEKIKEKIFGPENAHFNLIEKNCGVDLIFNEEMNSISVSGFDPARRELARATLEKLVKEKNVNEKVINNIIHKTKKSLFKKIKIDGTKLFKNLKLANVNPKIINMMGALRYRYSYAQNQYFHCSEVGFLCGLLSSELDLDIKSGRRAGVLHDLGKAMDHSIDGGHAVIGADFIEKNGESNEIVHAVRAHHYDVQPTTPLCYLVIAADALSGARPGARRSTADAYMQKMGQLEEIGNSFKEVKDTYIMSAGREVRVLVDSREVDDHKAITLSKEVAKKIEEQCNYPGLIKVTVVRRIQAIEMAK